MPDERGMSDSRDLFEKADALLGRYRGENRPDADFPVLTEVVEVLPAPGEGTRDRARMGEQQVEQLRARLLEKLQPDIEALVSSALEAARPAVEEQLRVAASALLAQAESDVRARVREIVDQAVRETLERLRPSL
jgi:hypothetical protein